MQVGSWALTTELGRGGSGVVWATSDASVAVKVLARELLTDPSLLEALREECQPLVGVDSPFRPRMLGVVVDGEIVGVGMERLEGVDLRALLRDQGPVSIDLAVHILEGVLGALADLHGRDRVHGDVRPAHVFLCADGQVKLLESGVARACLQVVVPEATHDYRPAERGPSADVYAAGVTLWEALVGRSPCPAGPEAVKAAWHASKGPADVRTARTDTPAWLAKLLGRLTSRDPNRRPKRGTEAVFWLEESLAAAEVGTPVMGDRGPRKRDPFRPARPPGTLQATRTPAPAARAPTEPEETSDTPVAGSSSGPAPVGRLVIVAILLLVLAALAMQFGAYLAATEDRGALLFPVSQ